MTGKRNIKQRGFTFFELIILIMLLGISAGILIPFTLILFKNIHGANLQAQTVALAKQRMELILASKKTQGFDNSHSLIDPCTMTNPPAECTLPAGFSMDLPLFATAQCSSTTVTKNNCVITIVVRGPNKSIAKITSLVTGTL
jgi:type II secretory pathway pseudopilin PulG